MEQDVPLHEVRTFIERLFKSGVLELNYMQDTVGRMSGYYSLSPEPHVRDLLESRGVESQKLNEVLVKSFLESFTPHHPLTAKELLGFFKSEDGSFQTAGEFVKAGNHWAYDVRTFIDSAVSKADLIGILEVQHDDPLGMGSVKYRLSQEGSKVLETLDQECKS